MINLQPALAGFRYILFLYYCTVKTVGHDDMLEAEKGEVNINNDFRK